MTVVSPGQWMASLDLKDAYFHIPIRATHHKFLRFHWLGQTYQFQALPFGLSYAPRVFTKVLVPVIAWLRRLGIQIFVYLDDILIVGFTRQEVESAVRIALQTLIQADYMINLKKSDLTPVQDLVYIGGWFRMDLAWICLLEDRKDALISKCPVILPGGLLQASTSVSSSPGSYGGGIESAGGKTLYVSS